MSEVDYIMYTVYVLQYYLKYAIFPTIYKHILGIENAAAENLWKIDVEKNDMKTEIEALCCWQLYFTWQGSKWAEWRWIQRCFGWICQSRVNGWLEVKVASLLSSRLFIHGSISKSTTSRKVSRTNVLHKRQFIFHARYRTLQHERTKAVALAYVWNLKTSLLRQSHVNNVIQQCNVYTASLQKTGLASLLFFSYFPQAYFKLVLVFQGVWGTGQE